MQLKDTFLAPIYVTYLVKRLNVAFRRTALNSNEIS